MNLNFQMFKLVLEKAEEPEINCQHPLDHGKINRVPENTRRDKKVFIREQCKEIEENNRMGKLEISLRKLEIPREHFMQRWVR